MLVLTRRIGEEIVIAGDIRVKVLAVYGQRVRLGISAPPSVPVTRLELLPEYSEGVASPTVASNRQNQRLYASSEAAP
jgi:carbon storage regulator